MKPVTLLMDTDIFAYRASCINESKTAFGKYVWDFEKACRSCDEEVAKLASKLKATRIIMCLSDEEANWRKDVLPTYKAKRAKTERPEQLYMLKDYLASEYESKGYPTLEADDVMGILATHPHAIDGKKIIVSEDKDMRTIPSYLYAPHRPELKTIKVTELQADQFHMWQALVGDPTDGYGGAFGIGKGSIFAQALLEEDRDELWDTVLAGYGSVGLTETDAIQQARVARILRAEDYNIQTKVLTLWEPELLAR